MGAARAAHAVSPVWSSAVNAPRIVCPLHWHFDPGRLGEVYAEMQWRGAPRLRGHLDPEWGVVLLREWTHRIHAAAMLGLVPRIVLVPWWRSRQALTNALFAAARRGLRFPSVVLLTAADVEYDRACSGDGARPGPG